MVFPPRPPPPPAPCTCTHSPHLQPLPPPPLPILPCVRYRFTVTASQGVPGGLIPNHPRSASTSVVVTVLPGAVPALVAQPPLVTVNPQQIARLNVTVVPGGGSAPSLLWTAPDLTASGLDAVVVSQTRTTNLLSIRAGPGLSPGSTYSFVLTATVDGVAASATVQLVVNQVRSEEDWHSSAHAALMPCAGHGR
jgi:hypothetical protein